MRFYRQNQRSQGEDCLQPGTQRFYQALNAYFENHQPETAMEYFEIEISEEANDAHADKEAEQLRDGHRGSPRPVALHLAGEGMIEEAADMSRDEPIMVEDEEVIVSIEEDDPTKAVSRAIDRVMDGEDVLDALETEGLRVVNVSDLVEN